MINKNNIGKVIWISLIIVWLVYLIVGDGLAILYINYPNGLQENMLNNLPQESYVAIIVRLAMALTCITTYPLTCIPPASMIEQLIMQWKHSRYNRYQSIFIINSSNDDNNYEPTFSIKLFVRIFLVFTTTLISIAVPCFGDIIAVVGCFTVTILSFILPPVLHLKLISYPKYYDDTSKLLSLLLYSFDIMMIILGLILWILGTSITIERIRFSNSC